MDYKRPDNISSEGWAFLLPQGENNPEFHKGKSSNSEAAERAWEEVVNNYQSRVKDPIVWQDACLADDEQVHAAPSYDVGVPSEPPAIASGLHEHTSVFVEFFRSSQFNVGSMAS